MSVGFFRDKLRNYMDHKEMMRKWLDAKEAGKLKFDTISLRETEEEKEQRIAKAHLHYSETVNQSRIQYMQNDSDWSRHRPESVNWKSIWQRHPKHRNCPWKIGQRFNYINGCRDLCCVTHGTMLQWVNNNQVAYLETLK